MSSLSWSGLVCSPDPSSSFHLSLRDGALQHPLTAIVGPNGAGKTTLLKTLSGHLAPKSGQVHGVKKRFYLPANNWIHSDLRANEVLELFSANLNSTTVKDLLKQFQIEKSLHSRLSELSSGERQKFLLCGVLSDSSPICFLDEPLSFLEWQLGDIVSDILHRQIKTGKSFVVSTHDLQWVVRSSFDETWVLGNGQVLDQGGTSTVFQNAILQQTFKFRSKITDNPLDAKPLLILAENDNRKKIDN